MFKFIGKLLDSNEKEILRLRRTVETITALEPSVKKLKAPDFAKKTAEFKERLEHGANLDELLPEVLRWYVKRHFVRSGSDILTFSLLQPLLFIMERWRNKKQEKGKHFLQFLPCISMLLPGEERIL